MRFKKLELLGFKSFAEATELKFEPGITAVVGPNGCGKSNVADAIKWVLGEQSARELRGGRMEDLIFNGSDRREPVNFAEVSLTLDNSDKALSIDYAEVTISRRLFRTGESEYLLNKTAVRLRDIQELLMGTGIGTSAYSLFEQGRIEQIINARPEERRVVFEEAAGITKFKAHKREAMRRLEETEDNLLRLSDVVAEVKRQIQSLERQVRRAKNYREQFEGLKKMEVTLARHETAKLDQIRQEKEQILAEAGAQIAQLEAQAGGQEEKLTAARQAVSQTDEALSAAREAHSAATHRREAVASNLGVSRERISQGQNRIQSLEQEIAAAQAHAIDLEEQVRQITELLHQEQAERLGLEQKIQACQTRLDESAKAIEEAQTATGFAQAQLMTMTAEEVEAKNSLNKARQELARVESRVSRLQSETNKVAEEEQTASEQLRKLQAALESVRVELGRIEEEKLGAETQLSETETALENARRQASVLEQDLTRLSSQWELLRGLVDTHEGYSSGVKSLLKALSEGTVSQEGVIGVLAELLQVSRAYAAALDAALGPWAEAVVVDSSEVAERCRQYLEETKAGRVAFLIKDRVPEQEPQGSSIDLPGSAWLFDRVGVTPHLAGVVRILLDRIFLVEDRQTARNWISEQGSRASDICLVTPEGELFHTARQLLGPAPSEEGMIVGRTSRLQALEVATGQAEGKLQAAQALTTQLELQRSEQVQLLQSLEKRHSEKTNELHRLEATHGSAESVLQKFGQEKGLLAEEESQALADYRELEAEASQKEQTLLAKEEQVRAIERNIAQSQQQAAAFEQTKQEASVEMATAKAELASFDEVVGSRRSSLQVMERSLEAAKTQMDSRREEQGELNRQMQEWEQSLLSLEQELSQLQSTQAQVEARVSQAQQAKAQALGLAEDEQRQFLSVRRQIEELQEKQHTQQMEQAQIAFQNEQISSRLAQLYQIHLAELPPEAAPAESEAPAVEPEPLDPEALKTEIDELSQKLQRMGPVNLGSIEEEQELKTRYEFMTSQQADLTKAKEDLHEALTKINRTTRAMFRETFEAIQKEFQVTYRQLFGGGEARLILMDEEDLLESGVEIIARPPGKALQPISLLSGGEKALTAIALMFAIFRIKPSPFCLMDEIDAPLDEANVDRFTRALKEFLKESQFIIITHNKKTMGMADVMYGVTMQEMGVSKMVSVKFNGSSHAAENGAKQSAPA